MNTLPFVIIPLGAALYHLSSKSLGGAMGNPWAALALAYFLACSMCLALALGLPGFGVIRGADIRAALPLALLLGLACVGIEGGYLLAYRLGWNVNQLFSLTSFMSTVAIFSVGFLYFREGMTPISAIGITFVLVGVVLVNWK